MLVNRERWQQSTTGSLRRDQTHWVFERSGQACRRCGTPIALAEQGVAPYARLSYWCPRCQLGPAPPAGFEVGAVRRRPWARLS